MARALVLNIKACSLAHREQATLELGTVAIILSPLPRAPTPSGHDCQKFFPRYFVQLKASANKRGSLGGAEAFLNKTTEQVRVLPELALTIGQLADTSGQLKAPVGQLNGPSEQFSAPIAHLGAPIGQSKDRFGQLDYGS